VSEFPGQSASFDLSFRLASYEVYAFRKLGMDNYIAYIDASRDLEFKWILVAQHAHMRVLSPYSDTINAVKFIAARMATLDPWFATRRLFTAWIDARRVARLLILSLANWSAAVVVTAVQSIRTACPEKPHCAEKKQ